MSIFAKLFTSDYMRQEKAHIVPRVLPDLQGGRDIYCTSSSYLLIPINMQDKTPYLAPACEQLELSLEGIISVSPGVVPSNPFENNTEDSWS